MKLHLDIDCTNLDDLKSAKATIDRLIAEHESKDKVRAEAIRNLMRGKLLETGNKPIEELTKITNPSKPIHYAPYGPGFDDKLGCGVLSKEPYTGDPHKVTCETCKRLSPGMWPEYAQKDVVKDDATGEEFVIEPLKNMRTRSEVIADRKRPHVGCCERYANQQGCDCLETAQPDEPQRRKTYNPVTHWACKECRKVWDKSIIYVRNSHAFLCTCGHVESAGDYPSNMQYEPCGDEWKCKCGRINAGKAATCSKCGK